jgi:soluble lytic murein transglycosylase-like protein
MQIKPATARGIGYKGPAKGLNDCRTGIHWGMKYLRMAIEVADGDLKRAAFLYNAGLNAKTKNPAKKSYVTAIFRKKDLTR